MATPKTRHAGDRHMFSSPNDKATMERILATHAPDGTYIHLIPLLQIVEEIMHKANADANHHGNQAESDFKAEGEIFEDVIEMLEVMSFTINKVSREISLRCIGGVDAHTTTMEILNILSNYGWDAKAVITLAAFALNYGEFRLVAQLYNVNRLAKSVAHLKQLSNVLDHDGVLKPQSKAVDTFIKQMLDLIHCILKFPELPEEYITPETPELVTAANFIPTVVYWIIQSVVGCVSVVVSLSGTAGNESMKTAWTVSSLAHKISNIHDHLRHQLDLCYNHINEMKKNEAYAKLLNVMESTHLDNMKPLKHLIYLKDDQLPLYDGFTQKRESIDILRRKIVLLLIFDLDVLAKEVDILPMIMFNMYIEMRETRPEPDNQYEVLWLPAVPVHRKPWTEEDQQKFEKVRKVLPWYSVFHLSLLEPAVIKYIEEVWHFNHKPLFVVMDPLGRIVNTNALHMIFIWRDLAFPFTRQREEALWQEQTWTMELLLKPVVFNDWIEDGKYIFLYGGEDIEWIRKFTQTTKSVATKAGIQLEMMYVGKSNLSEKVQRNNDIILLENLSSALPNMCSMLVFWARIESMLISKVKFSKSLHEDPMLREISVMLTYDNNDQGWAVMCHGSNDWMRRVDGDALLDSLTYWELWQERAQEDGFLPALNDFLDAHKRLHHCDKLILPETTGSALEIVGCSKCGRSMERSYMYRCCLGMGDKPLADVL